MFSSLFKTTPQSSNPASSSTPKTSTIKYTSSQLKAARLSSTITLTFGDRAENHPGMQRIGNLAPSSFTIEDLESAKLKFEAKGVKCELINLNKALESTSIPSDPAALLIARGAVNILGESLTADKLFEEQYSLNWDCKALMYGKVVNKHARRNLCYSDTAQEADFSIGKGTVIDYNTVSCTKEVRLGLPKFLGEKAKDLMAEGNLYYDLKKCGVCFHGDTERRIVIGVRIGAKMNLQYQWFLDSKPIGERVEVFLEHGDLYVMSEKASGFDYKMKKIATLRHAAGGKKYTDVEQLKRTVKKKVKDEKKDKELDGKDPKENLEELGKRKAHEISKSSKKIVKIK